MLPHEAIAILDQATSNMKGSREDHMIIITAVQTLKALHPVPEKKEEPVEMPLEVPATCKG